MKAIMDKMRAERDAKVEKAIADYLQLGDDNDEALQPGDLDIYRRYSQKMHPGIWQTRVNGSIGCIECMWIWKGDIQEMDIEIHITVTNFKKTMNIIYGRDLLYTTELPANV